MSRPIGRTRWAIAEGYIPAWSHGPEPQMESHETACILNAGAGDAAPEPVPEDVPFACVIESTLPIVVQHTRLDSRQSENALMTTMAYPVDG